MAFFFFCEMQRKQQMFCKLLTVSEKNMWTCPPVAGPPLFVCFLVLITLHCEEAVCVVSWMYVWDWFWILIDS